jgi:hypothetical protein
VGRRPLFEGPASRRATRIFDENLELFRRAGYSDVRRVGPLAASVTAPGKRALRLAMVQEGKVFGGTYALELSTAEPVLPPTRGLSARGRGLVRQHGIAFRAHRGDEPGRRLAERLGRESRLVERLERVHFERLRIEPDGRPVIRHMGGSLV